MAYPVSLASQVLVVVHQHLTDYKFTTRRICFCSPEIVRPIALTVIDGTIESGDFLSVDDKEVGEGTLAFHETIDEQFSKIQDAVSSKVHEVRAMFHPEYGYPENIYIDYEEMIADEEYSRSNSDLSPIVARCGSEGSPYLNYCVEGDYCCNQSCGICAPEGGACTQQFCA